MEGKFDLEDVQQRLGRWSKWRIFYFLIVTTYKGVLGACAMMGIVFIGGTPQHHCKLPEGYTTNTSIPLIERNGVMELDSCSVWSNYSSDTNLTIPCPNGWDYSARTRGSIVEEWDLVCDRDFVSSMSQTILVAGVACGAFVLSICSDKFGRKVVIIGSGLALGVLGLATALVDNLYAFLVLRFFTGFFQQGIILASFVYECELFPPANRALMTALGEIVWEVASMIMALVAWLIPDWRTFSIVLATPNLLAIPLIWILPESLPWLVAKGRVREAKQVLANAAKWSHVTLPREYEITDEDRMAEPQSCHGCPCRTGGKSYNVRENEVKTGAEDQSSNYSFLQILRSPRLALIGCIMCYLWCVSGLVYFGISLNASALYGDFYINFMLLGLVVIPAHVVGAFLFCYQGRRWPAFAFHIITGVPLAIVVFIPPVTASGLSLKPLIVTLVLIAKSGIGICFNALFVYTPELYPTTLRNVGLGIASVGCRIGNLIAPFTPYVARHIDWLPNVVFGTMAIIGALLVLILPETKGRPLARTVEEIETWPLCCKRQKPRRTREHHGADLPML